MSFSFLSSREQPPSLVRPLVSLRDTCILFFRSSISSLSRYNTSKKNVQSKNKGLSQNYKYKRSLLKIEKNTLCSRGTHLVRHVILFPEPLVHPSCQELGSLTKCYSQYSEDTLKTILSSKNLLRIF